MFLDGCDMDRHRHIESEESYSPPESIATKSQPIVAEHYRLGYHECLSETMHFLVEVEGFFAGDSLCVQLINHLQKHCDKILKGTLLIIMLVALCTLITILGTESVLLI